RQDTSLSGGWMLEKCCHDMDILSYLLGSRPTRVFSMASALHFRPRPESEQLERFQPAAGSGEIDFGDTATNEALRDTRQHSPYASIESTNGTHAPGTGSLAQPRTTRRIRDFGTEGWLEGDISAKSITRSFPDPAGGKGTSEEQIAVVSGSSGHNGGDEVLGDTFWHLAAGEDRAPRAGVAEGIDAALTALALQRSAESGAPINMEDLRAEVFGAARAPERPSPRLS